MRHVSSTRQAGRGAYVSHGRFENARDERGYAVSWSDPAMRHVPGGIGHLPQGGGSDPGAPRVPRAFVVAATPPGVDDAPRRLPAILISSRSTVRRAGGTAMPRFLPREVGLPPTAGSVLVSPRPIVVGPVAGDDALAIHPDGPIGRSPRPDVSPPALMPLVPASSCFPPAVSRSPSPPGRFNAGTMRPAVGSSRPAEQT